MFPRSSTLSRLSLWLVSSLLFLAPATLLVWQGGTGYCFFGLFLIAVSVLATGRVGGGLQALRRHPWFWVGMLAFAFAIPIQWAFLRFVDVRELDALSRFALALPIYLMLRRLPSRHLAAIGWGCVAGGIAVGIHALRFHTAGAGPDMTRLSNVYTNAIPFGDMSLLLGILSLSSMGGHRIPGAELALRLLGLAGGCYASYLSGTRGGWIAIPPLVALLAFEYRWHVDRRRILAMAVAAAAVVGSLGTTLVVRDRIAAAVHDITVIRTGGRAATTSVGARLALWRASLLLYELHPWFGVGKGRLEQGLADLARKGEIPAHIVNERAHSDLFSTIAELGSIGAVCLALLYLGLAQPFWRHRRSSDPALRSAAYSGLVVVTATVIYGLTIDDLAPVMVDAFTALLVATFLATVDSRDATSPHKTADDPQPLRSHSGALDSLVRVCRRRAHTDRPQRGRDHEQSPSPSPPRIRKLAGGSSTRRQQGG